MKRLKMFLFTFMYASVLMAQLPLLPGMKAPELAIESWVKGQPVAQFEPGKIYVVEFWAIWCGPCIANMPHLTKLAKAYPEVTMIGVNMYEPYTSSVRPFVAKMGAKMDYNVAISKKIMEKDWMEAANLKSIPAAFIIGKNGTIEFIGYTSQLVEVLPQVVGGTWDVVKYKTMFEKDFPAVSEAEKQALARQRAVDIAWDNHPVKLQIEKIIRLTNAKKFREALKAYDVLEKMDSIGSKENPQRYAVYWRPVVYEKMGDKKKFYFYLDKRYQLLKKEDNNFDMNNSTWYLVDPKGGLAKNMRDYQFILKWANYYTSNGTCKAPEELDTLAWAYFLSGNKRRAAELEERALKLLAKDDSDRPQYENALQTFQ